MITIQHWTILQGGQKYVIAYLASLSTFNSPVNTEILDHFIKSFKIVSSNKNP